MKFKEKLLNVFLVYIVLLKQFVTQTLRKSKVHVESIQKWQNWYKVSNISDTSKKYIHLSDFLQNDFEFLNTTYSYKCFNRRIFYLMTTLRTTISGILLKLGPMWPFWKLFRCEKYFQSQPAHMGVGPHPIFQLTV